MGKKAAPAPAPAAPQPSFTQAEPTQNQPNADRRAAIQRLQDTGQPTTANVMTGSSSDTDPLGQRKTLSAGTASMMG